MTRDDTVLVCGPLRVAFERQADRYSHRIYIDRHVDPCCEWKSCEGTANEIWPASPPLQSLHLETRPDGVQIAMLVGMAGRGHWSVTAEPDLPNDRFLFDIACRVKEPPAWLGSCYHRPREFTDPCIAIVPVAPATLQINNDQTEAKIGMPLNVGPWPCTIRWRYAISLLSGREIESFRNAADGLPP